MGNRGCVIAFFLAHVLSGWPLFAAGRTVHSGFIRPWVWGVERLAFRRHVEMAGPHNFFRLDLVQWQAEKNRMPAIHFWLHEPRGYGNFSRPLGEFFQFTVNGIPEKGLHLTEQSVRLDQMPDGSGGCEVLLNYDGARFSLRWYMHPDSALMHCRIRPLADSLSPVQSARVTLKFVPSTLRKNSENKVLYDNAYARQAVTALRVLEQNAQPQLLEAADQYLILQDLILDGSGGEDKGAGPCFLRLDFTPVQKALLKMTNSWIGSLEIDLKADFQEFHFALWQHKNVFSNQQFYRYFTENPSLFQLE